MFWHTVHLWLFILLLYLSLQELNTDVLRWLIFQSCWANQLTHWLNYYACSKRESLGIIVLNFLQVRCHSDHPTNNPTVLENQVIVINRISLFGDQCILAGDLSVAYTARNKSCELTLNAARNVRLAQLCIVTRNHCVFIVLCLFLFLYLLVRHWNESVVLRRKEMRFAWNVYFLSKHLHFFNEI